MSLFGQTIYKHDLDEKKLTELKENIRHLSKKPERWTYDTDREFNEAVRKFDQNSGGSNHTKSDKKSAYESPEFKPKNNEANPESDSSNFSLPQMHIGPIGKALLYIVLGGVLVALIYFLFVNSEFKRNGKKYESLNIDNLAPSDIPKTELERLLEEALSQKNYREAVRIYYLFILKGLSEKHWIHWEKQKTNLHYIAEMRSKKEVHAFHKVVTYFEFIWYGKREISETQFQLIQPDFTALLKILNIK